MSFLCRFSLGSPSPDSRARCVGHFLGGLRADGGSALEKHGGGNAQQPVEARVIWLCYKVTSKTACVCVCARAGGRARVSLGVCAFLAGGVFAFAPVQKAGDEQLNGDKVQRSLMPLTG